MPLDLIFALLLTTIIQAVFGVGVLLFGTPWLLLLGYSFTDALWLLLPVSIMINSLQIAQDYREIHMPFYIDVLRYSIPLVVVCLFVAAAYQIDLKLIVGVFLLWVALKDHVTIIDRALQNLMRYPRAYLLIMGAVHGLTNLGGSLLTAWVHQQHYPKAVTRVTIAACYATFAVFQLVTLALATDPRAVPWFDHLSLMMMALLVYVMAEQVIYHGIEAARYRVGLAVLLAISGTILILRAL